IGINRYRDARIQPLALARRDAEEMERALRASVHPSELEVQLLCDEKATGLNIDIAIGEHLARRVTVDDIVLLYFAGHGSPESVDLVDAVARFLIAHDTNYEYIWSSGIDMERRLSGWFARLTQPRLVLLVVDACFSGGAGGRTFEGPKLRKARAETRSDRR